MMAVRADPVADRFEQTEERLKEWGLACRHNSEVCGLPTTSTFKTISRHVEAEHEKKAKRDHKDRRRKIRERLRRKHAQWKDGDPPLDPKEVAIVKGFAEPGLTAEGKQSQGGQKRMSMALDSKMAQIDGIVTSLPKWAQKCIRRRYLYGQPDRIAAEELKQREAEYAGRCRCAVEMVAERLAQRYSSSASR